MYICIDDNGYAGKGKTINEAFEQYSESYDASFYVLEFYECKRVNVELVEKPVTIAIEKKASK